MVTLGMNIFMNRQCKSTHGVSMYSRIHEKLLILYFENARGAAPERFERKESTVPSVFYDLIHVHLKLHIKHNQFYMAIHEVYK